MAIHRLYGELAALLVRATTDNWVPGEAPARAGANLHDLAQGTFQHACDMVGQLGLATDEHGTAIHHWSTHMKLAIDADRVAQFVTDRSRAGQITLPPIDDVIAAWIMCADHNGHVSAKRLPFIPHDDVRPVLDALAALGYAKRFDNAFIWTDKIGRAMQMSGSWDENNLSFVELEEREVDLEMRAALASIPDYVRHAALRGDRIAVVKALAARWIDGAWLPDSAPDSGDENPWWRWAALAAEAKRLVELVQGTDDPLTREVN